MSGRHNLGARRDARGGIRQYVGEAWDDLTPLSCFNAESDHVEPLFGVLEGGYQCELNSRQQSPN